MIDVLWKKYKILSIFSSSARKKTTTSEFIEELSDLFTLNLERFIPEKNKMEKYRNSIMHLCVQTEE